MLPVKLKIYRTQDPDTKINVEGNMNNSVVIITQGFINANQNNFLKSILASVKIGTEDVMKIAISDDSIVNLKKILPGNKEYILLIFGCTPGQLGMHLNSRLNEVVRISSFSLLFTHSLEQLDKSVALKKALWISLKQIFFQD